MATKCKSPLAPQSLEWCEGEVNLPGLRPRVYFTPKRNIVLWPALPNVLADGDSIGKIATYLGDFKLAADTTWNFLDILVDKSPATSGTQGNKPSKTFLNQATLVVPKTDAEAAGLSRVAINSDYVYLVQQKDGKFRVLGNEMYQTNTDVELNLGGEATEDMGTTLTIQVTDIVPNPFYEGQIETEDGIINPSTPATP